MTIHISRTIKNNCWNLYDSYGEICVHCGCCSTDPVERAKARLKVCEEQLKERTNFNDWMEGWEETQRMNIASDIFYLKKKINYYKRRLKKLEGRCGKC